ncbi:hypothetical protein FN846DRAFT_908557 [Sphaerosporella brunnea]|uniref:Uncharacterized protein n=1 Tax=Sphaerosporella brunnea TaxID=1250544 RepID=A0A5J5ET95_9PEZI|nr:hypothetical protein FN846DRAFT_908557 [Sphaerosporella brunnea]
MPRHPDPEIQANFKIRDAPQGAKATMDPTINLNVLHSQRPSAIALTWQQQLVPSAPVESPSPCSPRLISVPHFASFPVTKPILHAHPVPWQANSSTKFTDKNASGSNGCRYRDDADKACLFVRRRCANPMPALSRFAEYGGAVKTLCVAKVMSGTAVDFWEEMAPFAPELAELALKLLRALSNSVPSEQSLSTENLIRNRKRNTSHPLGPEIVRLQS